MLASSKANLRHVVVIATIPGRESLLERALGSVARQSLVPVRVIVVPDCDAALAAAIGARVRGALAHAEVVPNRRTRGLSGSCNSAIDHLLRTEQDPGAVFVSFLDDDDTWDSDYLEQVSAAARGADFVAGTIVRHDVDTPEGRAHEAPEAVSIDAFLVGNSGVQGSSLSARLSALLLAGTFDEALSSCTDRDLVIRLLEVGARYRAARAARAHHDTLHGHPRLSDAGLAKSHGLDVFFAKYGSRMTPHQREAFKQRAETLFQWSPRPVNALPASRALAPVARPERTGVLTLVAGVVVDGNLPRRVLPLLDGLASLASHPRVARFEVVLLENGANEGFEVALQHARNLGLKVWSVDLLAQAQVAPSIGLLPTDATRAKAIAISRTLLQQFVHEVAAQQPDAVAWILDDDVRPPADASRWVDDVLRAKEAGFDVLIGSISGSPPVPPASTLRTQLVDVHAFLAAARVQGPERTTLWHETSNARWKEGRRDYYYDLTRIETDRLETPFVPPLSAATIGEAIGELAERLPRILAGEAVTRTVEPVTGDVVYDAKESRLRGGNTLVFALELLRDVPNLAPRVGGRPVRRSDMLWAANASLRLGRKVVSAPFDVVQDRSADAVEDNPGTRLLDDILGYGFFRAYEEVLSARGAGGGSLSPEERGEVIRRARKHSTERFAAYRLAFWRSRGLSFAIRRCIDDVSGWVDLFAGARAAQSIRAFVDHLDRRVAPQVLEEIEGAFARAVADDGFAAYLEEIDAQLVRKTHGGGLLAKWRAETRVAQAACLVRAHLGRDVDELLGSGAEGVVFRVDTRVFKLFDRWSAAGCTEHGPTLFELAARPRIACLPRIISAHDWSGTVVLETEWEASEPYEGGHGPELANALRELVEAGFVHTNLAPKNLRVMSGRIQLIDLGRSLVRANEPGIEAMVRRAFLGWRFAFRPDLASLARRSLTEDDLPELVGWRGLLDAVRARSLKDALDGEILRALREDSSARVLDFGCGKPRPGSLVGKREGWVGFDPDPALAERWASVGHRSKFWTEERLNEELPAGARFDAVICSLVLCTVDDAEALAALHRIRRLVVDDGSVVVAVCDPTSVHVRNTTHQHRRAEGRGSYHDSFSYEKRVSHGVRCRVEIHRSVERYRRLFAASGLAIVEETTVDGVDLERFEAVSEFLVFRLCPLPRLHLRTSLLVKVCALEAETVQHQVRHLVQQLGQPRAFDEVVVVCDPHRGPFPRSHGSGRLEMLRIALDELVRDGLIDRVVDGPIDGEEASTLAQRWYGATVSSSRAANGQPLLAFGAGVEACTGDLILHADADVLVSRPDPLHDHIVAAAALFDEQPAAITLALPVLGDTNPVSRHADERGPFRVDTQVGWIHRQRLLDLLPLPNTVRDGVLQLPWHRALDRVVRSGVVTSVRRGSPALWFTSPDNVRKHDRGELLLLMDRVEAGWAPRSQRGRAATAGTRAAWAGPKRTEAIVVVCCGRNVGPGRVRRCLSSLTAQTSRDWGAIIVDDASDDGTTELLQRHVRRMPNVTLVRRRESVGALANTVLAVRDLIANPDSVVVLLDLDDALGKRDALERVLDEHRNGADVTVGSMIRTDRHATYEVDFADPRTRRGGNVWQHLRTFRKSLFDRIDPQDLQLDGRWIDLASDWAFMIPMVEMAQQPRWIREVLYLHEPGEPRSPERRAEREMTIARILARPRYPRARTGDLSRLTVLAYHRVLPGSVRDAVSNLYRARGMVVSLENFRAQMRTLASRFHPVSILEVERASRGDAVLPSDPVLVTFDDGYSDFGRHVAPCLEELGVPSVLFARVPLADDRPSWAPLDVVYHGLATAQPSPPGDAHICGSARELLLGLPPEEQQELARSSAFHLVEEELEAVRADLYLSGTEIRDLASRGFDIGAHGTDHVRWTGLDDAALRESLSRSRGWIRSLGQRTLAVSFPDGAVDERVARAAEEEGFSLGFALTKAEAARPANLLLRRLVAIDDPGWIESLVLAPEAAE